MNICVTGSRGFIGSHLVDRLRRDGHTLTGIDDGRAAVVPCSPQDMPFSVADYFLFAGGVTALPLGTVHHLYHLASPVGPVGVLGRAGRIAREIVDDTVMLGWYCARNAVRMLFVSSSEIYGADGPCEESDPALVRQASPSARLEYAAGKLAAEIALANIPGLDYRIVRPFNVAGPRQSSRGGFVLPRFLEQAIASQPLTVYGTGDALRAFTHVYDIVEGLVAIMEKGHRGPAYNLGNPANLTTIMGLAQLVLEETSAPVPVVHVDPSVLWGPAFHEVGDKWPRNVRAMAEVDWSPRYGLREIVQDALLEMKGVRR